MRLTAAMAMVGVVLVALAVPAGAQVLSESFDSLTPPNLPTGWTVENTNGDSYTWETGAAYSCSPGQAATIRWNASAAMDDWLFTSGLSLSSGHTYTLTFNYRVASSTFPEKLEVFIGTGASSAAMTTELIDLGEFSNTTCQVATVTDFTVPAVGTYYIGFHGYSDPDEFRIVLDDVVVTETAVPVSLSAFSVE